MDAADTAHAADGDTTVSQLFLLGLGDPADISGESLSVIEFLHDERLR